MNVYQNVASFQKTRLKYVTQLVTSILISVLFVLMPIIPSVVNVKQIRKGMNVVGIVRFLKVKLHLSLVVMCVTTVLTLHDVSTNVQISRNLSEKTVMRPAILTSIYVLLVLRNILINVTSALQTKNGRNVSKIVLFSMVKKPIVLYVE